MRKMPALVALTILILVSSGPPLVLQSEAARNDKVSTAEFNWQTPGSRCTRLTYPPRTKTRKRKAPVADSGLAFPGSRCTRLTSGPRKGKILPNTAPRVGLAVSTTYIGANSLSVVKVQAIACDLDGDTVLYTYTATAGRIEGDGPEVVWDLGETPDPGEYVVAVEVDDGCGCVSFSSSQVSVASVP